MYVAAVQSDFSTKECCSSNAAHETRNEGGVAWEAYQLGSEHGGAGGKHPAADAVSHPPSGQGDQVDDTDQG